MKKIIQGNNGSENKTKGNILDYIATKNWEYGDGPEPRTVVRELPILHNNINNKMSKTDEYNTYFNKKSDKYYNRPKSKSRNSGTVDIAWELPHEIEEDLYGKYLELLKSGDLAPNTSFERFEKLYHDFGVDIISKKKRMDDQMLSNAIAKIDNAMSGISGIFHMGSGGPIKNKPKEPTIKKLNLADYFRVGMRITELTPQERELVNELVKKSLSYNKDN